LDWELLAQAAQATKDGELLAVTARCHLQTLRQMRWANAMPNIAKEWARDAERRGHPGGKVLSAFMDEIRKAGAKPLRDWDKE